MTIASRISDLAGAVRDKINLMIPRLVPAGGTVGQVLAKSSSTDYDSDWVNPSSGGSATVTSIEIDIGAVPVKNKTITVTDAGVLPTTKILAVQSGRAATGRPADENEMTRLNIVPYPETGSFKLWISCLTGSMRGKFIIDYIKG